VVSARLGNSVLANLVEESLVADLQDRRCLLAIPIRLFQRASNSERLGFVLGRAGQRFQASRLACFGRVARYTSGAVVARQ